MVRRACVVSTFDMVNVADLDLLDQVRQASDEMTVVVLADEVATALHGRAPVVPERERIDLVAALRDLDQVLLCTHLDQLPGEGVTLYSDEELLADRVDVLLAPRRRSASGELRRALAHGHPDTRASGPRTQNQSTAGGAA